MKKQKYFILPLICLLLASCGNPSDSVSNSLTSGGSDTSVSSPSSDAPKLDTPVLHLVNDSLDWSNDRFAASYDIYKNDIYYTNLVGSSWKIDVTVEGTYQFSIVAKSKNYSQNSDSDKSNVVTYNYVKLDTKSVEFSISLTSGTIQDYVSAYLYANFEGASAFKYYPLSLKNNKYIYEANISKGNYKYNVFLGTVVDVDDTYKANNYVDGGNNLAITDNKSYSYTVSFAAQPAKPTTYKVSDYYDGYYSNIVSWTDSENLLSQINSRLNDGFVSCSWDNTAYKWTVLQNADETLDNLDRVDIVYTDDYDPLKVYTSTSTNKGWQREHAFAQSLGNFDTSSTLPDSEKANNLVMRSDWHNLFASDGSVNGGRGNKNLGNVSSSWGDVSILKTSYGQESGCRYVEGVNVMEPNADEKGQLSRAILYMISKYTSLHLVDDITDAHNEERATGCRKDIISWASSMSIDYKEYKHNQVVSTYQKNRNPYVDYPQLVDFAFGEKSNLSVPNLAYLKPSYVELGINSSETFGYMSQSKAHLGSDNVENITYEVGDTFANSDFAIYEVKKDLFTKTDVTSLVSIGASPSIGYVFSETDVGTRSITLTIGTTSQIISYPIVVSLADPLNSCSYLHDVTGKAQGSDFYNYRDSTGPFTAEVTLDSVLWSVYFQAGKVGTNNAEFGASFGSGTAPCEKIIFSSDGFTKSGDFINKIYFKCSTIKDGSFDFEIKVGGNSIFTSSQDVGNVNANMGLTFDKIASAKIEVIFTNITKTLRIKTIGVNVVK